MHFLSEKKNKNKNKKHILPHKPLNLELEDKWLIGSQTVF